MHFTSKSNVVTPFDNFNIWNEGECAQKLQILLFKLSKRQFHSSATYKHSIRFSGERDPTPLTHTTDEIQLYTRGRQQSLHNPNAREGSTICRRVLSQCKYKCNSKVMYKSHEFHFTFCHKLFFSYWIMGNYWGNDIDHNALQKP